MNTKIKKAFVEIVDLLQENKDLKVNKVLDRVLELASTNRSAAGSTYIMNTVGEPVAILCYYFKRWMPLVGEQQVEFSVKKNTSTGLNSMCKEGNSLWTKQQRVAKQKTSDLLNLVAEGTIKYDSVRDEQAKIESARKEIEATELGFETKEEVIDYLVDNGVELS